jgi:hypothetical protein
MYILNWDPEDRLLEANLAGTVTPGEASAFVDDVRGLLLELAHTDFSLLIDAGRARGGETVGSALDDVRSMAIFAGASRIRCILADEEALVSHTESRFDAVMRGAEAYELRAA